MEGGRWSKKAKNLSTYFVNDLITKILNFNSEREVFGENENV